MESIANYRAKDQLTRHVGAAVFGGTLRITRGGSMTRVMNFFSVNEVKKPVPLRVYHDNDACAHGQDISEDERRPGTNGYTHCGICIEETIKGH
jgi:hypothetical protein